MASFRGHLATSAALGVVYGGAGFWYGGQELGAAVVATGLTAVGGLLPDLDSDHSVPNRTLFRLASAAAVGLAIRHVLTTEQSVLQSVILIAAAFVLVRYVLAAVFRRCTVHRGMFHSIPAMAISGLGVFLLYHEQEPMVRLFAAGAIMVGFLSHLVLDELCAVDFRGARLRKPFGTALKLTSPSWVATAFCYGILLWLALLAWRSWPGSPASMGPSGTSRSVPSDRFS
jgi:hypothetical protein